MLLVFAGYKIGKYDGKKSAEQVFTCQFTGEEWTKLTGFKDVKAAREYLNKDSVDANIIFSSVAVEIKEGRDKGIFSKPYNHYHFEEQCYKPYKVTIKDEHSVILTCDNDTIVLYLENATNMAEEKLIYILPTKE
jgi:hypothetical protein